MKTKMNENQTDSGALKYLEHHSDNDVSIESATSSYPEDDDDRSCNRCCDACVQTTMYKNLCFENVEAFKECGHCLGMCTCQITHGIRQIKCDCVKDGFTVANLKRKVPILGWLPKYRLEHLQGDLIAGITVALTVLPQALAYAKVAGLSPEYGLYSSFMCGYMYGTFGTSKDLVIGTTAVMSLLTEQYGHSPVHGDATYAIMMAFMCGCIQLLLGILHLGFIVNYVSHPVIHAFIQSSVLTIMFGQIDNWLGLTQIPSEFFPQIYWICAKLPETYIWDFVLGLVCMICLYLMKKMRLFTCGASSTSSIPVRAFIYIVWLLSTARNAIIVILAAATAGIFYSNGQEPFNLTGFVPPGLPSFKPPAFSVSDGNTTYTASDIFSTIGSGFVIVPIVSLVEAVAISKSFARKNKYHVDPNQELIAIGIANLLGSFVSAYPVTGSFSRSAVNGQSGVKTPGGNFVTATLVVLVLAFLTPLFYYVPDAALAAIIIMAVADMIDYTPLIEFWHVKKIDIVPWFLTFILGLIFGIEVGLVVGIVASICIMMYPTARPGMQIQPEIKYTIITINQGLLYPSVEYLKDHVMAFLKGGAESSAVILDFSHVANIDSSMAQCLKFLADDFEEMNSILIFSNLRVRVHKVLNAAEIKVFRTAATVEDALEIINITNKESDCVEDLTRVMYNEYENTMNVTAPARVTPAGEPGEPIYIIATIPTYEGDTFVHLEEGQGGLPSLSGHFVSDDEDSIGCVNSAMTRYDKSVTSTASLNTLDEQTDEHF